VNYSFTSLGRFVSCPRQWMLMQLGFKEQETTALQFGSLVHECISQTIQATLRGEKPDLSNVVNAHFPKYSLLETKHQNEALDILHNWYVAFSPLAYTDVATEVRTVITLERDTNIVMVRDFRGVLKGNPDIVEVIDWKTGWKDDPEPYAPQVAMYLWATEEEYPGKIAQGYLWWLRYKSKPKCLMDSMQAEDGKAWALSVIERIKEAEKLPADIGFPATPGKACHFCGVSWACLGGYVPQEITTEEEAKEVAGFALQLDSALAICKEALKRYLKRSGGNHVEIGGEYWGNYPRVFWKFADIEAFKNLVEEAGYDPYEFLTVDTAKLRNLLKTKLKPKLEAMGEKKVSSYFAHRSSPPDEEIA